MVERSFTFTPDENEHRVFPKIALPGRPNYAISREGSRIELISGIAPTVWMRESQQHGFMLAKRSALEPAEREAQQAAGVVGLFSVATAIAFVSIIRSAVVAPGFSAPSLPTSSTAAVTIRSRLRRPSSCTWRGPRWHARTACLRRASRPGHASSAKT